MGFGEELQQAEASHAQATEGGSFAQAGQRPSGAARSSKRGLMGLFGFSNVEFGVF